MAIVLLVGLSVVAFQGLSGARAYVHGESQWTKAQKQAVIALFDYAATGEIDRYRNFERALEVNHGDRRARLTLESDNPDYDEARQGFRAGRNPPEDIEQMIRLFIVGKSLPKFRDAIETWSLADTLIAQLEAEARVLRNHVETHGPGSAEALEQLEVIKDVDQALTRQEDRFSFLMGRISHRMAQVVSLTIVVAALLLILSGSLLSRRLARVSERRDLALRESEQRYRALVDQPEVGMWQIDPDGRIIFFNEAMRRLLGLTPSIDVGGQHIDRFIAQPHRHKVAQNRQARVDGNSEAIEVELLPEHGPSCIALVHGAPIRVGNSIVGHVGTCVDITARKQAERELRHQALHDPLTGLPNRKLFLDRLEMAIKRGRRNGRTIAVLFIDLDRFKVVNDGLGHSAGDEILIESARRLQEAIREPDSIARFGGDEFGVVLEQIESIDDAIRPAERITEAFETDFKIRDLKTRIRASVGIALANDGMGEAAELLSQADIAMYSAKREGGGRLHVYDEKKDAFQQHRLRFESDLLHAARRDELRLLYQPIIDLESRQIITLEALVRWNHPQEGCLAPDRFIELAEETGAIGSIGRWVVERACEDFTLLQKALGEQCPEAITVNISDAEFRSGDPAEHLRRTCARIGLQPSQIQVEVTESMVTLQPEAIRRLNAFGHPIAIDDFGTGFASLERLRTVPFNVIKVDRSFIWEFLDSEVDRSIIEAVVHIGQRLGVRIIAEGIETSDQADELLKMGCRFGQGFLFSRPVTLEDIQSILAGNGQKQGEA